MLDLSDVVADVDLQAPKPFTILRSTGQFVFGGFQSSTVSISAYGPVQRATDREIQMLPEADRVSGIMAFWWTQPIYGTRGAAPLPSTHGEVPAGAIPGTNYTLSAAPPGEGVTLFKNGVALSLGSDYAISGNAITLTVATESGDKLYVTWPVEAFVGQNAADILVYEGEQYRVLAVKHYPGSGFFKALGTRMSAI
jgi:hypothetical protein